jgi:tetratricopeptide (TPR) repeat protein
VTTAIASEVAQRANARAVVTGEVHRLGGGFVLTASVIDANSAQALAEVRETATSDQELIPAVNRLSKALRGKIGESLRSIRASAPLEQVSTSSLEALRLYSTANVAFGGAQFEQSIQLLKQAVAADTGFAMAWRKLAVAYTSLGATALSIAASRKAFQLHDRLPPLERHLTDANYLNSVMHDNAGSIAAYRAALAVAPDDKTATNNIGLMLNQIGRAEEAEGILRHGIAVNPVPSMYLNLATSLALQQKLRALDSVPDMAVRAGLDSMLWMDLKIGIAQYTRDPGAISSLIPAANALYPVTAASSRGRLLVSKATMEEMRGQLTQATRTLGLLGQTMNQAGNAAGPLVPDFAAAWYAATARGKPDQAWSLIEQALARRPLDSIAPADRPYFTIGLLGAIAGRAADVKRLRAAWEAVTPAAERDSVSLLGWDGMVALSDQRWDLAADGFRQMWQAAHCSPCGAYEWAYALDKGGHADSAIGVYRRIIESPNTDPNGFEDGSWYPLAHLRIGEYYQDHGDKAKALTYLTRFTEMWKGADADLQPKLNEAKARIAELSGEKKP